MDDQGLEPGLLVRVRLDFERLKGLELAHRAAKGFSKQCSDGAWTVRQFGAVSVNSKPKDFLCPFSWRSYIAEE